MRVNAGWCSTIRLDDVKRKVLLKLQEDGRVSLVELGKSLSMTHVGVRKHLSKILQQGIAKVQAVLNVRLLGLRMCMVDVDRPPDALTKILLSCPKAVMVFCTEGTEEQCSKLRVVFCAETTHSLLSTVQRLSKEFNIDTQLVEVKHVLKPSYLNIPIPSRDQSRAPCGAVCALCERYQRNECEGCPNTIYYRGKL